jgi:hypothetical protein
MFENVISSLRHLHGPEEISRSLSKLRFQEDVEDVWRFTAGTWNNRHESDSIVVRDQYQDNKQFENVNDFKSRSLAARSLRELRPPCNDPSDCSDAHIDARLADRIQRFNHEIQLLKRAMTAWKVRNK